MSATAPLSYLTCTAAQADEYNAQHRHGFVSLNQLLESRADSHPNVVIAGFPERIADDGPWRMLSFSTSDCCHILVPQNRCKQSGSDHYACLFIEHM